MFIPHVNTGHIYIIKGDTPDVRKFSKEEWLGTRTLRALEQAIAKIRDKGKFWAFIQYEDDKTPLSVMKPTELLQLGVLKNKASNNNDGDIVTNTNKNAWYDKLSTMSHKKKIIEIK
jgi:hypothetical protein